MKEFNYNAVLLRIFISEADSYDRQPLYEALIYEARKNGMSGGTALKGIMSYGATGRLHTSKLLDISQDIPIIVEIIDTEEKVQEFAIVAGRMIEAAQCGGLITMEKINIIYYKPETPA